MQPRPQIDRRRPPAPLLLPPPPPPPPPHPPHTHTRTHAHTPTQCSAATIPEHCGTFSTLVGLLNAQAFELGEEIVVELARRLEVALVQQDFLHARSARHKRAMPYWAAPRRAPACALLCVRSPVRSLRPRLCTCGLPVAVSIRLAGRLACVVPLCVTPGPPALFGSLPPATSCTARAPRY